ncbi:MAG: alpha/beta hydrolase [Actinomycetota bacterium]|nr:alpha/beta hydrolase [Actinomycetota bacterium]
MPTARSGDISIHYESTGAGAPVLLVMGLGMNATGWWRTIPVLAEAGLRVLALDNRGVGRSDRPSGPYTTAEMADDAAAVLDADGVERAHIYGISLGGMIAQEIALRHPDRVERLVLGATTPGGTHAIAADDATLAFFHRRGQMGAEEAVWASVPYNYSAHTRAEHGDRIAEDIRQRLRFPIEPEPYAAQLAAALGHDGYDRLARITAPTLVVHGTDDVMVPPANGSLLADRIPTAELVELPGTAHLYPTDDPTADGQIASFLNALGEAAPPRR